MKREQAVSRPRNNSLAKGEKQRINAMKIGFIGLNGEWVIDPVFTRSQDWCEFSNGLACVERDGKYLAINHAGETVVTTSLPLVSQIEKGIFRFRGEPRSGYMDLNHKIIFEWNPHEPALA